MTAANLAHRPNGANGRAHNRGRDVTTPNNLPAELTSFVGREPQLAELRRLLHRSRVVTLTGPGGAGKSRLALRLASESLDKYPDGVWLLDLAPIGDGRLLEASLAAACGIKEEPKRPLIDVLNADLAGKRTLIVLDGCEHLVDSCAELTSRLLRSCPGLVILATSRETLGVTGEVIWRTPSLTIPRSEDAARPELLLESESIRLFVDRARLGRPEFELKAADAAELVQICSRLEGIPLAIELAAGLAGVMSLHEIVERLRHRFRLLTGGSRTSLPRHQTLRQAVGWSYGLLSPSEQALFARLGVFAGGFDLAAAEAVVAGEGADVDDVLPTISRLVQKSLIIAEPARQQVTRYRMLDTIREYATERLQQIGEAPWRQAHADYFTGWAIAGVRELDGPDQGVWLRRIDEELANIRLALEWSMAEDPERALRLAAAMGTFWWMRRAGREGIEWLTRTLDAEPSGSEARAVALIARARLNRRLRADDEAARRDAEECATLARRGGFTSLLAHAVTMLGIVTCRRGDYAVGLEYFAEARQTAAGIGDHMRLARSLNNMAMAEAALGRLDEALAHSMEADALILSSGNRFTRGEVLDTVGMVNFRLGNIEVARRAWSDALRIAVEFEDPANIADCLEGFAQVAMWTGDPKRALTLVSSAAALRRGIEAVRPPDQAADIDELESKAAAKLGGPALEAARQHGAALSMREAVAFALGDVQADRRNGTSLLTDREVQVARLIADGLTNGEMATRLRISERTVDAHLEHIRNKLGLRTRAQIAVWAHERVGTS